MQKALKLLKFIVGFVVIGGILLVVGGFLITAFVFIGASQPPSEESPVPAPTAITRPSATPLASQPPKKNAAP